ncbi:MAG: CU044_2847 family protein [Candidatus Electrothrix aestuarii]|uniref:CU044_2847 family protein n=1 Tax=Candidatus Electrothrix aestuarii TaxID=3062594 RepID=A0AAU8LZT5_9BACT|nr:CU044_2847 family protein [Candidatus Electrothrix aestuarii]
MKKLIEFELDGQPVYIEAEETNPEGMRRVSRGGDNEAEKADSLFVDAVDRIKPAAEVILNAFREMNTPDEIALEFGLNFSAKAGAFFTSADSSAAFKVSLKWNNK